MGRVLHFLSYHNAVPIALSFVVLSFGAAFAASEEVRSSIYDSSTSIVSVDNGYIASVDLDAYKPRAAISSVTEDSEWYYVAYQLTTIDVVDAQWRDVTKDQVMKVSKGLLGETTDLGLYVTDQLNQLIDAELSRLRETQAIERRSVTPRTVATEYSGLIGKFLDPTIEELPGYVPVVTPPRVENSRVADAQVPPAGEGEGMPRQSSSGSAEFSLTLLGDNPTHVPRGGQYRELGVVVNGGAGSQITIQASVDDGPLKNVGSVVLDSTYDRVWHIRYDATTPQGALVSTERYVLIGDAVMPGSEPPAPVTPDPVPVPSEESVVSAPSQETAPVEEVIPPTLEVAVPQDPVAAEEVPVETGGGTPQASSTEEVPTDPIQ